MRYRWVTIAILSALIVAGLACWLLRDGRGTERELAAKTELTRLGALVVMDAGRDHVSSVNLSTLKRPDELGHALDVLTALLYISSLNVDGTAFRDEHAAVAGRLESLQDLTLNHTEITDAALEKLAGLSKLKAIYLVDTAVTNAAVPALGRITSLKIVDISGTKVTGNLEPLRELPDLNWLVAQRLALDASAISSIAECTSLSRLTLIETTCPPEALNELERRRPDLAIDR